MSPKTPYYETSAAYCLFIGIEGFLVFWLILLSSLLKETFDIHFFLYTPFVSLFLLIPVSISALWECRRYRFDPDGMEIFYGKWFSVRYRWSELGYRVWKREEEKRSLSLFIWVKGYENSKSPIRRFNFGETTESAPLCYALRECFGREPDEGKITVEVDDLIAIRTFPLYTEVEKRKKLFLANLGVWMVVACIILFCVMAYLDLEVWGDELLMNTAYTGISVAVYLAIIFAAFLGLSMTETYDMQRCASFANEMRKWNRG